VSPDNYNVIGDTDVSIDWGRERTWPDKIIRRLDAAITILDGAFGFWCR